MKSLFLATRSWSRRLHLTGHFAGLPLLLLIVGALPTTAQPAMSRGEQDLPITHAECMSRAQASLAAEGYVNLWSTGSSVAGYKDIHSSIVMCNGSPSGTTWANVVTASISNDGGVPGGERQRLQTRMNQAAITFPPVAPCVGGAFTLSVSPGYGVPGSKIQVSFTAPGGQSARDWVGIFQVGASGHFGQWQYTQGQTSGSFEFLAPAHPGAYEFRYLLNDSYDQITVWCGFTVTG